MKSKLYIVNKINIINNERINNESPIYYIIIILNLLN